MRAGRSGESPAPGSLTDTRIAYGSFGQGPTIPGAAHSIVVNSSTVMVRPAGTRKTPLRSRIGPVNGSKATGVFDIWASRRITRSYTESVPNSFVFTFAACSLETQTGLMGTPNSPPTSAAFSARSHQ